MATAGRLRARPAQHRSDAAVPDHLPERGAWSGGLLGLAAASEPLLSGLAALFNGIGFGCVWNAMAALYVDAVRPEQRSDVFGANYANLGLGLGLGAAIAGAMIDPSVPSTFERMFLANALCLLLFALEAIVPRAANTSAGA